MEECNWCGDTIEEPELELRHFDRYFDASEYSPEDLDNDSVFCKSCVQHLAETRRRLQVEITTSEIAEPNEDLAFSMVRLIDFINAEPPGRDWEDTLP
jgi:hypothetical protein